MLYSWAVVQASMMCVSCMLSYVYVHVCIMYMYACKHRRLGGSGCYPRKCLEIRCSEIASEVIWDRSRTVVATWLAEDCIQFSAVHICILLSLLTLNFHKSSRTPGRVVDGEICSMQRILKICHQVNMAARYLQTTKNGLTPACSVAASLLVVNH